MIPHEVLKVKSIRKNRHSAHHTSLSNAVAFFVQLSDLCYLVKRKEKKNYRQTKRLEGLWNIAKGNILRISGKISDN